MSDHEVNRLNNLLHDGHMREINEMTGWSRFTSELSEMNRSIARSNSDKLLELIKKSKK